MSTTSIVRDIDPRRRELLQTAAALAAVGSAALVGAGRPPTAARDPGMFAYVVGAFTAAERCPAMVGAAHVQTASRAVMVKDPRLCSANQVGAS